MGKYMRRLFLLILFLVLCVEMVSFAYHHTREKENQGYMPAEELAGFLQVIPLSPEETRVLILSQMPSFHDSVSKGISINDAGNIYLTGADVDFLCNYLEMESLADTLHQKLNYKDTDKITYESWEIIFQQMLDTLGLLDQVKIIEIQYLGVVPGESRLMADSGNYDCDPKTIDFTYGERYEVYLYGNTILGEKKLTDIMQPENNTDTAVTEEIKADVPETVRVLLTQDNNKSIYRDQVRVKGNTELTVVNQQEGSEKQIFPVDQPADCAELMDIWDTDSLMITAIDAGRICVANEAGSAVSSYYRGRLYVYKNENGFWLVNEVGMEEYLYGVVPGEMPESFESEALKAQAVCARTYACRLVAANKYEGYHADLNDTTDCQVYLPSKENGKSVQAVNDTAGKVLTYQGYLAQIYYFSTSCGYTSGLEVWQTKAVDYLKKVNLVIADGNQNEYSVNNIKKENILQNNSITGGSSDPGAVIDFDTFLRDTTIESYDSESRYFRWTAYLDVKGNAESVKTAIREEAQKIGARIVLTDAAGASISDTSSFGEFQNMVIIRRNESGIVTDLEIQFEHGTANIYNENTIRRILGAAMISLMDKNGEIVNTLDMLPSAAFSLEIKENGTFELYGGGLGHGIGMSQYGANGMTKAGMSYDEILQIFFPGIALEGKEQ